MELQIDRREILRYLGYRNAAKAEQTVLDTIEDVLAQLQRVMLPKAVAKAVTLSPAGENALAIDGLTIPSKSLADHLDGCTEGFLFAATLGAPVDLLIQRYHILDMSKAVICQACAAAAIEAFCDAEQDKLTADAKARGLYLRPRFSPGYGDFPLTWQKEILELLNAQRRINLSRTESNMLVPTKSVTAVIGLSADATACHVARCMLCTAKNCPFRKE